MLVLKSNKQQGIKYFFDEWKIYQKDTIEAGNAHPEAKGTLIATLDVSLTAPDIASNPDLKKILDDCCPPEISHQGVKSCINFIEAFGTKIESMGYDSGPKDKIYIHTIRE